MNSAIIVAAGSGSRMASDRPKQFLLLAGIPLIFHTLRAFERCDSIDETIVVLPPESAAEFLDSAPKFGVKKVTRVVPGGATRADSVKRGLTAVRAASARIVAVHDGVRPFVSATEISETVAAAEQHGAAILVAPATDTIKQVDQNRVVRTLDRRELRRALTPQCFKYELLMRAFAQADLSDATLTDDSALVEQLGTHVAIVEGSARNIKITTPEDLLVAEALLKKF
ncbi:MAG TPA: 2-C-methyl-D-erythritol 4-phosphate cytidylyltransferase [Pyrinomonadaceae bacterium]|nr:2-C-methyl-D-erythritol 4-phosphate cytidylyltransferase [Pyrinomonadaceae bacterium]